ncbi:translation initiation factor IF-2-like [Lontra canadensis]|uniref:translation initiation factor IF-2-like n=1 Tax=Lontra canadensis TaxID=76717 RepID=UPI0013F34AD4|nr:translation initiation factor IF-2-like [Lontra canadensis]
MGRKAGSRSAEIAALQRAGIPAGFARVRSGLGASAAGTPAGAERSPHPLSGYPAFRSPPPTQRLLGPPRPRRPRPAPPPRATLGRWATRAAPAAGGGTRGAVRSRGQRAPGARGPGTHAAGRAARASPSPAARARAAVTSRAARQPRAPAGRARAAAEHMGPRAGQARGGLDPDRQRGAARRDGPRHPPGPRADFHAERVLAVPATCRDTAGSTFHGKGTCMDPLNPEWNFLKDLLGEKPWKQQKDKQNRWLGKDSWPGLHDEGSYILERPPKAVRESSPCIRSMEKRPKRNGPDLWTRKE